MSNGIGVAPIASPSADKNLSVMQTSIETLKEKRMEEKGKKAKGAPPTDKVSLSMEAKEAGKKGKAKAEATSHEKGHKGVKGHHEKGRKGVKGHHEKGPKGVNGHRNRITDAYGLIKKQAAETKSETPKADLASNVSANISLNGTATGKVEEKTPAAIETDTPKADLASNVSANISLNGTATGKVEEKTPAATETATPTAALPENDILNSLNNIDNSLNQLLSGNNGQGAGSLFNNLDNLASSLGALGNLF